VFFVAPGVELDPEDPDEVVELPQAAASKLNEAAAAKIRKRFVNDERLFPIYFPLIINDEY
ncbi:unnamed protein product, partial [Acidithrix sp. C25]